MALRRVPAGPVRVRPGQPRGDLGVSGRGPGGASPGGPPPERVRPRGPHLVRSGFVAVLGRPNVGKSTLVNSIVGEKVSIVTDKPQTTRGRIHGVLTTEGYQMVFTDTPGFHKPRTLLGERLNRMVEESTDEVDAVVLVVDAAAGVGRGDEYVARHRVAPLGCLKVCAVNKVDLVKGDAILPELDAAGKLTEFDHVVPVSAKTGRGVDGLVSILAEVLPAGPGGDRAPPRRSGLPGAPGQGAARMAARPGRADPARVLIRPIRTGSPPSRDGSCSGTPSRPPPRALPGPWRSPGRRAVGSRLRRCPR